MTVLICQYFRQISQVHSYSLILLTNENVMNLPLRSHQNASSKDQNSFLWKGAPFSHTPSLGACYASIRAPSALVVFVHPCFLDAPMARPPDDDPCSLLEAASSRPVPRRCGVVHRRRSLRHGGSCLLRI